MTRKRSSSSSKKKTRRKTPHKEKHLRISFFHAEKRLPERCPRCVTRFVTPDGDFELLGYGKEALVLTREKYLSRNTYQIISCNECGNRTMSVIMETRTSRSEETIRRLIEHGGFSNFTETRLNCTREEARSFQRDTRIIRASLPTYEVD